jgi:hypothetical protein
MKGIIGLISGLTFLSGMVLVMGVLLEPITTLVIGNDAVQALGWASFATDIRDTILRYSPLLFIAYLLAFAFAVAFSKGRVTEVRRR